MRNSQTFYRSHCGSSHGFSIIGINSTRRFPPPRLLTWILRCIGNSSTHCSRHRSSNTGMGKVMVDMESSATRLKLGTCGTWAVSSNEPWGVLRVSSTGSNYCRTDLRREEQCGTVSSDCCLSWLIVVFDTMRR